MLEFVYLFSWLKKKKKVKKNADNSNIEGEKKKENTRNLRHDYTSNKRILRELLIYFSF